MQARTRRNHMAVLVAMALCFTTTCAIQSDRDAMLSSGTADTTLAAAADLIEIETDERADSVTETLSSTPDEKKGADEYSDADLPKADLFEYDK